MFEKGGWGKIFGGAGAVGRNTPCHGPATTYRL